VASELAVTGTMNRRCSGGCGRVSWNRQGRPGLCISCIEDVFSRRSLEPLEPYAGRTVLRRCRCTGCGREMQTTYTGIAKAPGLPACDWCNLWTAGKDAVARGDFVELSPLQARVHLMSHGLVTIFEPSMHRDGDEAGTGVYPVGVRCVRCDLDDYTSCYLVDDLVRRGVGPCRRCVERPLKAWAEKRTRETFHARGLDYQGGGTRMTDPSLATCFRCGSGRRISLARLLTGEPPCLGCDGHLAPDRPCSVYLVHFRHLRVYKVGITHAIHGGRVRDHARNGGRLVESVLVDDRITAFAIERLVLTAMQEYRASHLTRADLPQGGWTEVWHDFAPGYASSGSFQAHLGAAQPVGCPGRRRISARRRAARSTCLGVNRRAFRRLQDATRSARACGSAVLGLCPEAK
jgi:hypothetical protein